MDPNLLSYWHSKFRRLGVREPKARRACVTVANGQLFWKDVYVFCCFGEDC